MQFQNLYLADPIVDAALRLFSLLRLVGILLSSFAYLARSFPLVVVTISRRRRIMIVRSFSLVHESWVNVWHVLVGLGPWRWLIVVLGVVLDSICCFANHF